MPWALPAQPEPPPATVPWKGGQIAFDRFLELTHTNAFVILRDGKLAYEWYRPGVDARTPMSSWSMSKSLVSLLVGQAIARGKLRESDRLVDLLPELKTGGDYDKVTVRDLLDMRSGVFVAENYRPYWPFTGAARMYLTRDLPGFIARNREMEFTPGSATAYRSVDTQLLGMALTRATGSNLADLLARDIWQPSAPSGRPPGTWTGPAARKRHSAASTPPRAISRASARCWRTRDTWRGGRWCRAPGGAHRGAGDDAAGRLGLFRAVVASGPR